MFKINKNKGLELLGLFIILVVTLLLRVPNLGYSDYIGDEHKAMLELDEGQSLKDFFLEQRKGPFQFLVSGAQYGITGTYRNELTHRIPFTIFGILSIFMFYALVKKLTKNVGVAFLSTFLLTVCGFIVGFARIAQYQNLNLLFSFAALYFYADLLYKKDNLIRSTLIGTLMLILSLLAHWDVIFIIPFATYIFIKFLTNKEFDKSFKWKLVWLNFALGLLILGPMLLAYIPSQVGNSDNLRYFARRVSTGYKSAERFKYLIDLYNPFVTYWFYVTLLVLGLIFSKKTWMYLTWFGVNYALFEFFARKPGTHIYNFLIPLFILGSIGIVNLFKIAPSIVRKLLGVTITFLLTFFVYQSYMIFVDHSIEYPWREEKLFTFLCEEERDIRGRLTKCGEFIERFETPAYSRFDKPPLFGFPSRKNWGEIYDYISTVSIKDNESFQYVTNEDKTISDWYLDMKYGTDGGYYAIAIKRPQSFVNDWSMEPHKKRKLVYTIENNGEEVVRIYRIEPGHPNN